MTKEDCYRQFEMLDYIKCADLIFEKLGQNFRDGFWMFLCEEEEVSNNPCIIQIGNELKDPAEDSGYLEILNAFIEEFGDPCNYYVKW